jgi:hypothetical protein
MGQPTILFKNQFGEETKGALIATPASLQSLSTAMPAKAEVTALSAESASGAVTIALSTSNTYTDAAVNAAVNTALASVVTQLNAIITQANALLAALKATT